MSFDPMEENHGHSPAAWTAVVIMLVAVAVGTIAFYLVVVWLVWAMVGLFFAGLIVGAVMRRMGYGVGGSKIVSKGH